MNVEEAIKMLKDLGYVVYMPKKPYKKCASCPHFHRFDHRTGQCDYYPYTLRGQTNCLLERGVESKLTFEAK